MRQRLRHRGWLDPAQLARAHKCDSRSHLQHITVLHAESCIQSMEVWTRVGCVWTGVCLMPEGACVPLLCSCICTRVCILLTEAECVRGEVFASDRHSVTIGVSVCVCVHLHTAQSWMNHYDPLAAAGLFECAAHGTVGSRSLGCCRSSSGQGVCVLWRASLERCSPVLFHV